MTNGGYEPVEILLVEDNPLDADLALRGLKNEKLANKITWVKDGQQALDYIFRRGEYAGRDDSGPRLILLDLKMPRVDGLTALRQIRADPAFSMLPIVILTSSKEQRDIVESYDLGVNSYIVKPVDFEGFMNAVAELGLYWMLLNQAPSCDP